MSETVSTYPDSTLQLRYSPAYSDVQMYYVRNGTLNVWEADDWQEAELSWKKSCYIHAGISTPEATISGPDAQKLVSMSAINNCYRWPVGRGKHLVMCDENGFVISHALVNRTAEDAFAISAGMAMAGSSSAKI